MISLPLMSKNRNKSLLTCEICFGRMNREFWLWLPLDKSKDLLLIRSDAFAIAIRHDKFSLALGTPLLTGDGLSILLLFVYCSLEDIGSKTSERNWTIHPDSIIFIDCLSTATHQRFSKEKRTSKSIHHQSCHVWIIFFRMDMIQANTERMWEPQTSSSSNTRWQCWWNWICERQAKRSVSLHRQRK